MLTIVADSNIAHLQDYFNEQNLGVPVQVVTIAGRDIDAQVVYKFQPDALLVRSVTQVNAELLQANTSVKYVGSATIGTDHIDQTYLAQRHIHFTNAAGSSKHSVAQYVLSAILTSRPEYWQASANCIDNTNTTTPKIGIIGLGNIGSTLAAYVQDLDWQVLGYDPFIAESKINNSSFEMVLEQSDVISLHVPLTIQSQSEHPTYHLLDSNALQRIDNNTMLINTARGSVISEFALLNDLHTSQRQVVLDVFEHEPKVSAALLKYLALATPHIAGYTLEGKLRGTQMVFDAFANVFKASVRVTASPSMETLLPDNPYYWQELKDNPSKLTDFYNIQEDDALLRASINPALQAVPASKFDTLRKNYKLRREWHFDE